ncbi:hypothetical protein C1J01_04790 [Nonomuraea aridisoli]|uniref:Uncharacterized protein n=1 Tax=Nonomuraea aridisoli TaxID=2070368 RepID=A0A2W2F9A1_9ACTN|nr:hypothetical protein C1J01_04790 [Nonomuraea aridisoli]
MGRPSGEVSAGAGPIPLGLPPHYAYLPIGLVSDHLASFALQAAFPPSLTGRDSGDYYEASVAIGLAPDRRSRVRLCCT